MGQYFLKILIHPPEKKSKRFFLVIAVRIFFEKKNIFNRNEQNFKYLVEKIN